MRKIIIKKLYPKPELEQISSFNFEIGTLTATSHNFHRYWEFAVGTKEEDSYTDKIICLFIILQVLKVSIQATNLSPDSWSLAT